MPINGKTGWALLFAEVKWELNSVYYRVYILAKKVDGERIGSVWTSEEIEVTYV